MDKFLLLRDNKQTGPYSAADLEQLGLKPYDLIWVDGKSAAWRYPGEIDALKAFAPAVKEQPYDRFYKKPEEADISGPPEPALPAARSAGIPAQGRHIFVSVPSNKRQTTDRTPSRQRTESVRPAMETAHQAYVPASTSASSLPTEAPQKVLSASTREKPAYIDTKSSSGIKPFYYLSAALLLFALISAFLFVGYRQQNRQLNRLNEIVLNMQQGSEVKTNTPVHSTIAVPETLPQPVLQDSSPPAMMQYIPESRDVSTPVVRKKSVPNSAPVQKDSIAEVVKVQEQPVSPAPEPAAGRQARKRNYAEQVRISTSEYKTGFLGGISDLKVTLSNNGDRNLDQVEVQVEYLSKENKVVKTQSLLFRNLEAGAQLTQDVPRTARGFSVRCRISTLHNADKVAVAEEPSGKTP